MVVWLTAYQFVWMDRRCAGLSLLCLWVLEDSFGLPLLPFARSLVRLLLGCQAFMFTVIYPLLNFIWLNFRFVYESWDMVLDFVVHVLEDYYMCWDIYDTCFSAASFMKIRLCMFWENVEVTSKLFWIICMIYCIWGLDLTLAPINPQLHY
jgi:hypothetical protein